MGLGVCVLGNGELEGAVAIVIHYKTRQSLYISKRNNLMADSLPSHIFKSPVGLRGKCRFKFSAHTKEY